MITLYADQDDTMSRVLDAMARTKYVLLQAATGSGKTCMASWMIKRSQMKGKRSWFTTPRKELTFQTHQTFDNFDIPHSYIAAENYYDPKVSTHICSVPTLIRRLDQVQAPHLAVIDEAHYGGDALDTLVKWLKAHGSWIVTLSATPWKLSGAGMGKYADEMVCGPSIRWLIDNKRLSDYRLFAPHRPDLSGIKTVGGDYAKGQLCSRMENDQVLIGDAVKYYKEHAMGKLGVTYCVSRKHSQMTADRYKEAGVIAVHIDGETPDYERRRIIRAYANREIHQLCNAALLTFGFDLSAQVGLDVTVEAMTDLAPTLSLALQMQKWGRVLRYKDFHAMIFDHAGNVLNSDGTEKHGFPCKEREWSLADREKSVRGEQGEKTIAVRTCPKCFLAQKPAPRCQDIKCGYEFPIQYREISEVDGELEEIKAAQVAKSKRMEVGRAKTLEDLIKIADERGYKRGWVYKQAQLRGIHT